MSCVLDFTFTVLRKIKHVNKNVDSGHPKNQFTNGEVQQNVGSLPFCLVYGNYIFLGEFNVFIFCK